MSLCLRGAAAGALLAVLGACGAPSNAPPPEKDKALQRAVEAPQDRARAVEDQLQDDLQRKREAADAQSESDEN